MEKLKLHTPDLVTENINKLAELFPSCVTETRDEQQRGGYEHNRSEGGAFHGETSGEWETNVSR